MITAVTDGHAGFGLTTLNLSDGDAYDEVFVGRDQGASREVAGYRSSTLRSATAGVASPPTVAGANEDFLISGPAGDSAFAMALGSGDVLGDGVDDLLVVSPGSASEVAWLFSGLELLGGVVTDYQSADCAFLDNLGQGAAGVGALVMDALDDGDSLAEVFLSVPAMTVPQPDSGPLAAGGVLVFPGSLVSSLGSIPLTDAPLILSGEEAGAEFGTDLVNLGDVDGDGYPDLGVSAPSASSPGQSGDLAGRVYVFSGARIAYRLFTGAPLLYAAEADLSFTGQPGDQLGLAGPAGDLDGDGRADILLTAPLATVDGNANAGRVYVWKSGS